MSFVHVKCIEAVNSFFFFFVYCEDARETTGSYIAGTDYGRAQRASCIQHVVDIFRHVTKAVSLYCLEREFLVFPRS